MISHSTTFFDGGGESKGFGGGGGGIEGFSLSSATTFSGGGVGGSGLEATSTGGFGGGGGIFFSCAVAATEHITNVPATHNWNNFMFKIFYEMHSHKNSISQME